MKEINSIWAVQQPPQPGPEHALLNIFIGKWINEGYTVAGADMPAMKILTSDIYEWMPGGFFVLHTAYGRIGDQDVGGTEIIGYDAGRKKYLSYFYNSQGNFTISDFTIQGDACTWTEEKTRCTAYFSEQGKVQTAHHERKNEAGQWEPSMNVTLIKVA